MFTHSTKLKDYGFRVNARLKGQYLIGTIQALVWLPAQMLEINTLTVLNDCIV